MLYASLLVAAAALSGLVSAQQNNTSPIGPCCNVDAGTVPPAQKTGWCDAQRNTCPEICGGRGQIAQGGNTCTEQDLSFKCECRNGTKPDMKNYEQSVPGQMCRFWFDRCIEASGQDVDTQFTCITQKQQNCGNLTSAGTTPTSSGASSSTPTPSGSGGGGEQASQTGAAPSGQSSGAASALALAREYGTPALAGGIIALLGFAL
ncbi:hypothetical protein BDV95DRAFT_561044 [Massariosphaeria phaeospora]|uniref:DUF7707 domain-containing protein n=1 Tax=Massariosphaeria phaeospora TaxID=100035 RepID=A0A7C8MHF5_9PLEO|nr:hypothetical protein BDV95DRAFT_561044 [Massariosphaeria phaeospora]